MDAVFKTLMSTMSCNLSATEQIQFTATFGLLETAGPLLGVKMGSLESKEQATENYVEQTDLHKMELDVTEDLKQLPPVACAAYFMMEASQWLLSL